MKYGYILVLSLTFILLFSCINPGLLDSTSSGPPAQQVSYVDFKLVKRFEVTTDNEGGSARPEIIATGDRIFVVYLGNISRGSERFFGIKIYNSEMDYEIVSRTLVSTTLQYGGPTDIRITSDSSYVYAFYETNKTVEPERSTTYLWGAKYNLDEKFERVAYTESPIASSKPMSELQNGGELLDDPAPLLGMDSVFVVTRLKYPLGINGDTVYRVREFNKDSMKLLRQFDLDLSDVADGRARVCSLLFDNDNIYIALATTTSDRVVMESNDDGTEADIILVRLGTDWFPDMQGGVRVLSAEAADRENYISGFVKVEDIYYLAYKQAVGGPPTGEQKAMIKVYDKDFRIIGSKVIKTTTWGPSGGEIRPSIAVFGNRIISGQSCGKGIGKGNAEIYILEVLK